MSRKKRDRYFSVEHEPVLSERPFAPDPAEERAAPVGGSQTELEALRHSAAGEPVLSEAFDPQGFARWLAEKRAKCSTARSLGATLLAAVLGGPAAVIGALVAGHQGVPAAVYLVVIGPVVEELLKQCGMTWLLEHRPYRILAAGQFVLAGVVSGLIFGVIENLVYFHVYLADQPADRLARVAAYRWTVCTALHVVCAGVASLGLVRAWRRMLARGRPAQLSDAAPWFVAAIVIHGCYNLAASFLVL